MDAYVCLLRLGVLCVQSGLLMLCVRRSVLAVRYGKQSLCREGLSLSRTKTRTLGKELFVESQALSKEALLAKIYLPRVGLSSKNVRRQICYLPSARPSAKVCSRQRRPLPRAWLSANKALGKGPMSLTTVSLCRGSSVRLSQRALC
jgi:hypothetical protein